MKKLRNTIFSVLVFSLFLIFLSSCSGLKQAETQLIVPDFSFRPPSSVAPGSAGINIAMIEPVYKGNFQHTNNPLFMRFRSNMGKDFEEILTAHGYIIKGPYEVYDLMTFSDKEECLLGLAIEIDLHIDQTSGGWTNFAPKSYAYGITSGNYSTYEGTVNFSGKITISIIEPFTFQKLLVRSVPIPQENIPVKAEAEFAYGTTGFPINDPGVHNPIANSLISFYKSTMQRGWDMLSKDELEHVQKQVPGIREKAGFIKR